MHIENSIFIKGEIDKAFEIMADIESWHKIFPHIYKKKVKILKKEGNKLFFEKEGIIKFKSTFVADYENKVIRAEHFEGLTRGLVAMWRFEEAKEGIKMIAFHKLDYKIPLFGITIEFITAYILKKITKKTLRLIKERVEAG
ncbi:MAG: SRPBCC family protein [bacterium]